jgi:hypothetical protein
MPMTSGLDALRWASWIFQWVLYLGMTVAWVIVIVLVWRIMRAHEQMADTLRSLAEELRRQAPPGPDHSPQP